MSQELLSAHQARTQLQTIEGQREAAAAVERLRLKNKADFKQAVSDGRLQLSDNPYVAGYISDTVNAKEASDFVTLSHDQFNNSPLRYDPTFADNPANVGQWYDQQAQKLVENRTPEELAAMAPVLERGRALLVNQVAQDRSNERKTEMAAAATSRVQGVTQNLTPDLVALYRNGDARGTAAVGAVSAQIMAELKNLSSFMPTTAARSLMLKAVLNNAQDIGDPKAVRGILYGVQTDEGKTLMDEPNIREELRHMDESLDDYSWKKQARAREADQWAREDNARKAVASIVQGYNPKLPGNMFTQAGQTLEQLRTTNPQLYPVVAQQVTTLQSEIQNGTAGPKAAELLSLLQSGDKAAIAALTHEMLTNGYGATVENTVQLANSLRSQTGKTDDGALGSLYKDFANGDLTVDKVTDLRSQGVIKDDVLHSAYSLALQSQAARKEGFTKELDTALHGLPYQIAKPKEEDLYSLATTEVERARIEAVIHQQTESASSAINADYVPWLQQQIESGAANDPKFREVNRQKIQELTDKAAQLYGGFARSKLQDLIQAHAADKPKTPPGPAPTPLPSVGEGWSTDPVLGVVGSRGADWQKLVAAKPIEVKAGYVDEPKLYTTNRGFWDAYDSPSNDPLRRLKTYQAYGTLDGNYSDPRKAGIDHNAVAYLVVEKQLAEAARQKFEQFKPVAEASAKALNDTLNKVASGETLTSDEWFKAHQYADDVIRYARYRQELPYSIEEVKAAGNGAEKSLRMFVNFGDLVHNAESVASKLNIPEDRFSKWFAAQRALLPDQAEWLLGNRANPNFKAQYAEEDARIQKDINARFTKAFESTQAPSSDQK